MNGPEHFDPDPALPPWQADRLATLLDALDGTPISGAERASLTWLCGFEADTVEHLAAMLRRATARSTVLARRAEAARDEAISRHREADRYRGQLLDLCEWAGIDPGEDPHAALLAHLRGREGRDGAVPLAADERDIVGWADQVNPAAAEVLCRPCWDAALPHERVAYWCPVRRSKAHLAVCAVCGNEPGGAES